MSVVVTQPEAGGVTARRAVLAVAVLLAAAVAVAALLERDRAATNAPPAASTATSGLGQAAPFTLPSLRSPGEVSLAAAPGKPTVLNFFAAWCEPCRQELPALRTAARDNPGVAFLGVDHQDSRDDAIAMLDEFAIAYPAGYDPKGEVATKYHVRGMPTTVFIDAKGRVVSVHQGALAAKDLADGLHQLTLQGASA
ncbi:MAG: cytochrome c biosis protein CcmG, thiol:disulfide interchange protein DsbE [Actinomycetota bacterium]|nr:cytochrome c biosis protein CcmG, thiol:disulfide interchange protein DsbE [Actinomycetota bacterium]